MLSCLTKSEKSKDSLEAGQFLYLETHSKIQSLQKMCPHESEKGLKRTFKQMLQMNSFANSLFSNNSTGVLILMSFIIKYQ